jgi:sugar lactone lactonase YvrE
MTGHGPAVELVAEAHATLGEGPVWDVTRGVLWWVDIVSGLVHCFDPRSGLDRAVPAGSPVGALAMRRDGTLLAALQERLAVMEPESGRIETLVALPEGGRLRCNDGKCDSAGRFWVDRMTDDGAPGQGSLLRVDTDLSVACQMAGLQIPNGLAWSADGRRMYFVDSAWHEVREYDYEPETGRMSEGHRLVGFANDGTFPDGLTVDAEGCLWVARWGAGCVVRVAQDGVIVERVEVPVAQATSCAFGGDDLQDLYITTASEYFGPADFAREPLAGSLFRCRPGVRGLPPAPFGG